METYAQQVKYSRKEKVTEVRKQMLEVVEKCVEDRKLIKLISKFDLLIF
jgi:hypothetical protein